MLGYLGVNFFKLDEILADGRALATGRVCRPAEEMVWLEVAASVV